MPIVCRCSSRRGTAPLPRRSCRPTGEVTASRSPAERYRPAPSPSWCMWPVCGCPFTSESKEAIAAYPEIEKQLRLGLQSVGRKLGMFLRRRNVIKQEGERRSVFLRYLNEVADGGQRDQRGQPAGTVRAPLDRRTAKDPGSGYATGPAGPADSARRGRCLRWQRLDCRYERSDPSVSSRYRRPAASIRPRRKK